MKIRVQRKNVYGNDLIYPVCDTAKTFAEIAGQKTLTTWTMIKIKQLGYSIVVEQEEL